MRTGGGEGGWSEVRDGRDLWAPHPEEEREGTSRSRPRGSRSPPRASRHALSSPLGPSSGPDPGCAWFWLKKSKLIACARAGECDADRIWPASVHQSFPRVSTVFFFLLGLVDFEEPGPSRPAARRVNRVGSISRLVSQFCRLRGALLFAGEASHLARASALSRDSVRSRAPSRGTPARARVPFLSPTRRRWGCLDARCYARGTAPAPRLGAPSRSRASPS